MDLPVSQRIAAYYNIPAASPSEDAFAPADAHACAGAAHAALACEACIWAYEPANQETAIDETSTE